MRRAFCYAILLLTVNAQEKEILWRTPGTNSVEHWTCGPAGCDRAPAPPFHFEKEDTSGTSPKISVRDAKGVNWNVKFGGEVIPECFGSRFVTAVGYLAEPTYFVASGKVEAVGKLKQANRVVHKDGSFARARFQMRGQKDLVFLEKRTWAWNDNPFRSTRELAGLKILMMLLSNWDAKDPRDSESNNNVFRVPGDDGRPLLFYSVSDWGASLGHWGGLVHRNRSDCSAFVRDTPRFVKGARGDNVEFGYTGKHAADIREGITKDDVRWLLPYLQRITAEDLRAGFKASGATDRQTTCWADSIQTRIQQLQNVLN